MGQQSGELIMINKFSLLQISYVAVTGHQKKNVFWCSMFYVFDSVSSFTCWVATTELKL